jgi:putative nucleotidyltransferase with HDIG domain
VGGLILQDEPQETTLEHEEFTISLTAELALTAWVFAEAQAHGVVRAPEIMAVASALGVGMHTSRRLRLPQVEDAREDSLAAHAVNVSVLAMGLAECLGCPTKDARDVGIAALLHDIGHTSVPSAGERPRVLDTLQPRMRDAHATEGARLLLRAEQKLELAAVVAYEHHLRPDGTGYPPLQFKRDMHWASRVVQVCDTYDDARASARNGGAEEGQRPEGLLEGKGLDTRLVDAFAEMIRHTPPHPAETA